MILSELLSRRKTLYVSRPLINIDEIRDWALEQGFTSVVDDPHVTIAFSKRPVEWQNFTPERNRLIVRGGERQVKPLGDKGAVVLAFSARLLQQRWQVFCDGGASWDYDKFQSHLTITYAGMVNDAQPYDGDLIFGPEKFAPIDDDWNAKISEVPLDSAKLVA